MTASAQFLASRALFVTGAVLLGTWGYHTVHALVFQERQSRELDRALAAAPPLAEAAPVIEDGPLFGRLEIPRLGLTAMVAEGVDDATLRIAVGHVPGTGLPGQPDRNVGLAGHRDSFFRPLEKIAPRERITLTTPYGTYEYEVAWTRIVEQKDVWVLDDTHGAALTLVTCYPFRYVGAAPKRFIVRAVPVAAPPAGVPSDAPAGVPPDAPAGPGGEAAGGAANGAAKGAVSSAVSEAR